MHQSVERSIALWKSQNGPFRENIGKHLLNDAKPWTPFEVQQEHPFYIDYSTRCCDWV